MFFSNVVFLSLLMPLLDCFELSHIFSVDCQYDRFCCDEIILCFILQAICFATLLHLCTVLIVIICVNVTCFFCYAS